MQIHYIKNAQEAGLGIAVHRVGETLERPDLSELINEAYKRAFIAYQKSYQPYIERKYHNPPGVALISAGNQEVISGFEIQNAAFPSSFSPMHTALLPEIIQRKGPFVAVVTYREEDTEISRSQISGAELDLLQTFGENKIYVIEFNQIGFKSAWCLDKRSTKEIFSPYEFKIDPQSLLYDKNAQTVLDVELDADCLGSRPIILDSADYLYRLRAFTRTDLGTVYEELISPHIKINEELFLQAAYSAFVASTRAFEPFKSFAVGAAIISSSDKVVAGANFIIPDALSVGKCAERSAMANLFTSGLALDEDGRILTPKLLVVVAPKTPEGEDVTPCGECRQALVELGRDMPVLSISPYGHGKLFTKLAPSISGECGRVISFNFAGGTNQHTNEVSGNLLTYPFSRESLG